MCACEIWTYRLINLISGVVSFSCNANMLENSSEIDGVISAFILKNEK